MNIRKFAKENDITLQGKLRRLADPVSGASDRLYCDEGGNLFYVEKGECAMHIKPEDWSVE